MKKALLLPLLFTGLAFGQARNLPVCNGFDANGVPINMQSGSTSCTDYFGTGNWANSPLPAGTITGFTLIAGGSGYTNAVVVIDDPTGSGVGTVTATLTGDVVTAVNGSGGSGYIMPQVTIVDVGPGGAIGAATCDVPSGPPCGTGAMAVATLGGPFTGGIPKFVDPLPDLKSALAAPDSATYNGADFYVIGLVQYSSQMHSSLPPTTLRGYCQLTAPSYTTCTPGQPSYLGPVILAQKNKPVRVLFKNLLPTGTGGNLFVPVDTTYMGSDPRYSQNRATLHLHGGNTPWISDGTPHQWTAPKGEPTSQPRGASTAFVPDMWFDANGNLVAGCQGQAACGVPGATNDPGAGAMTFYWTNQQGGRLMFYHDHAYGITRLNVYAGEAAGYLLYDPVEENALATATAPGSITAGDLTHRIPLVIQDRTFAPSAAQLAAQDPLWTGNFGSGNTLLSPTNGSNGDLWFPHIYVPNQNPLDPGGSNAFGRWDYGPWFFPPQASLTAGPLTVQCTSGAFPGQAVDCPITPGTSGTPEAFMDTPLVNGKAYPTLHVAPAAYRLQILAAGNDRSWNLSWFVADATGKEVSMVPAVPPGNGTPIPLCTAVNPVAVPSLGMGLATALLDNTGNPMNGTGLPANCWPNFGAQPGIPAPQTMWAADGRSGGAPDPRTAGPAWIQIGTEGGLLPVPVVIPPTPVNYEQNPRSVTVTNVAVHGLWVGPAERADVIVDFSRFAGKTLILYNDAPTPAPAPDSRTDYFTGNADQTPVGGAPSTQPGYGPNTRTVMQVVVDGNAPNTQTFNLTALKAAFTSTATTQGIFQATQPPIIVPEAAYGSTYNASFPNTYSSIQANNLTFTPIAPVKLVQPGPGIAPCIAPAGKVCVTMERKAIQELFTSDYGRMNATLGTEMPLTNFLTQTTIPLGYIDPPTEIIQDGETQLWKITHNGVDTHWIHFHLFNVQVVNRVGWDGTIRPPDSNEFGWKDTVRMNPLEDILVALTPLKQDLPWPLPDSIRMLDVTMGQGTSMQFTGVDPFTNNPAAAFNALNNFGWEYVWHCHILGHEENDMMRPIVFQVNPPAPSNLAAAPDPTVPGKVNLTWKDNSANETGFTLQRDTDPAFPAPFSISVGPSAPTNVAGQGTSWGGTITANDTPPAGLAVYYRVQALSGAFNPPMTQNWNRTSALFSTWSNTALIGATPSPTVSATQITFPPQLVNTTSAAQTVTLSNAPGAGTLAISGVSITGGNAGDYSISANTCGAGLAGGLSCTISVTFKPLATGARAGTLIVTNTNSPPISVVLNGTGLAPLSGVSPVALLFGNVPVGVTSTPQTVTLSNTGTSPLTINSIGIAGGNAADFAVTSACTTGAASPLAVGGSCTMTVTLKPAAMGTRSSVLVIKNSDPVNPTLNVSLTGFGTEAIAQTSPTSVTFPLQLVNTSSTAQAVTLTNAGNIPTAISSIALSGTNATDFLLTYTCAVNNPAGLAAGANCTISLTFRPTGAGARSATLTIKSDALVGSTLNVQVTGTGTSVSVSPTALTFVPLLVGSTSATQTVSLINAGPTALVINSVSLLGGNTTDFTLTNPCPIGGTGLASGSNCKVTVRFAPKATGLRSTTLTIATKDPGLASAVVALSGTGIQAGAVLAPTSLSFGTVTRGQISTPQPVTLTNTGSAALSISRIAFGGTDSGQFSQTNNCGTSVAIGASCTINITFAPKGRGAMSAILQVTDNAPNSPQTVALSGTSQ